MFDVFVSIHSDFLKIASHILFFSERFSLHQCKVHVAENNQKFSNENRHLQNTLSVLFYLKIATHPRIFVPTPMR